MYGITYQLIASTSGSPVVERWTRNQVSPGSNPPLLPFGRLGIFLLSIDAPVDSAVSMSVNPFFSINIMHTVVEMNTVMKLNDR